MRTRQTTEEFRKSYSPRAGIESTHAKAIQNYLCTAAVSVCLSSYKNPTKEEWAAFAASCNLRDMGTHLCALPTGEH
jgi:hypothetical protein